MKDIYKLTAQEMTRHIQEKKISSRELVQSHIEMIEKVNPSLNAVVEKRYDQALKEADLADQKIKSGAHSLKQSLLGVPFTVKEMFSLPGMHRTGGCYYDKAKMATTETATVVQRLVDAGAIPLATTNVSEQGFWFESDNPVYGRTNNPYDFERTCGGSSGGEGSIIGAGASPFGVGSDIGGSIRIPAAFCGIAGHKPTNRTLPLTGHHPFSNQDMLKMKDPKYPVTTTGPLARSAKDLPLLFELMSGPDQIDQQTVSKDLIQKNKQIKKVYVLQSPSFAMTRSADEEIESKIKDVADHFENRKLPVTKIRSDIFHNAFELWSALVEATESTSFESSLNPEQKVHLLHEYARLPFANFRRHTFPTLTTVLMERLSKKFIQPQKDFLQELEKIRNELNAMLDDGGILLMPAHSRVAPIHRQVYLSPFDFIYTGVINALGNPATAIAAGYTIHGLPIGIQIVGSPFADYLTMEAAVQVETKFGGWQPPNWMV